MSNTEKTFCENCRNDVTYIIENRRMEGIIKEEKYEYMGKVAYCSECGSEVYVDTVNDYNLEKLYDAYRERNGIISLKSIREIPEKYHIGKRPLSVLLGWGENTYSRYMDGDVPSKQYSDILEKIYSDPMYYNNLLEENKNRLASETTYKKSKEAVQKIIDSTRDGSTKIDVAIKYLLHHCEDVTPLALQKMLYYIQGFFYAFYKTFLFDEDCEAWVHGPVYKDIYFKYRDYRFDPIEGTQKFDCEISSSEKAIFESVTKYICCYSGKVLEQFTHCENPWLSVRGDLAPYEKSNRIIEKEVIGNYFSQVKEKYQMLNPNDIKSYAEDMFQRI